MYFRNFVFSKCATYEELYIKYPSSAWLTDENCLIMFLSKTSRLQEL